MMVMVVVMMVMMGSAAIVYLTDRCRFTGVRSEDFSEAWEMFRWNHS